MDKQAKGYKDFCYFALKHSLEPHDIRGRADAKVVLERVKRADQVAFEEQKRFEEEGFPLQTKKTSQEDFDIAMQWHLWMDHCPWERLKRFSGPRVPRFNFRVEDMPPCNAKPMFSGWGTLA